MLIGSDEVCRYARFLLLWLRKVDNYVLYKSMFLN